MIAILWLSGPENPEEHTTQGTKTVGDPGRTTLLVVDDDEWR